MPEPRTPDAATAVMLHSGVLEATVAAKPGDPGGLAGSALWAGAVGHAFLRGDTVDEVFALMPQVTDAYSIVVDKTATVGA